MYINKKNLIYKKINGYNFYLHDIQIVLKMVLLLKIIYFLLLKNYVY